MKLTKEEIKEKLQALSAAQQIEQPNEEVLDASFLNLVYNAQCKKTSESELGIDNENFDPESENFDLESECRDYDDVYWAGNKDGVIQTSRWVLENLFGINSELLKQLLS